MSNLPMTFENWPVYHSDPSGPISESCGCVLVESVSHSFIVTLTLSAANTDTAIKRIIDARIRRDMAASWMVVKTRDYFLNRLSKALRASEGRVGVDWAFPPPESRVSRSMDVRAMKRSHLLRRSFFVMRSGIGCVHSNWAEVSK